MKKKLNGSEKSGKGKGKIAIMGKMKNNFREETEENIVSL